MVIAPGWVSHVELQWDSAGWAVLLCGVAEHARVLVFDKRGTGLSDRVAGAPTREERSDDIRAVMDAAGSDRAALFVFSEGASMCVVFAALGQLIAVGLASVALATLYTGACPRIRLGGAIATVNADRQP